MFDHAEAREEGIDEVLIALNRLSAVSITTAGARLDLFLVTVVFDAALEWLRATGLPTSFRQLDRNPDTTGSCLLSVFLVLFCNLLRRTFVSHQIFYNLR